MSHRRGFTLIELIIYVGIFSIAAMLLTGVLTTFTKVQVQQSATTEVSGQAQFVIQTIQRLVTDASLIELAKDAAVSTLKLRMPVAAQDPTCIQFSNGTIYLMQGNDGINKQNCFATSTPQAKTLTTSKVVVNSLTFKKFENPPSTDTVKIDLTVSYSSTNPQESAISRTLQTAIAKVSAATFDSDIIPSADDTHSVGIGANRWKNGLFSTSLVVGYSSVTGGVAAFNGNVGVGTSAPGYALDVSGGFRVGNATSTNGIVFNPGTGNVGIGTTGPVAELHIKQSGNTQLVDGIVLERSDTTSRTSIFTGGDDNLYLWNGVSTGGIRFLPGNSNANAVQITSGGNVGIGTTAPDTKLHISGGMLAAYPKPGSANYYSAMFSDNTSATLRFYHSGGTSLIHTDAGQNIAFGTNGANERMRIDSAGNVGIGTTNPNQLLHLSKAGDAAVRFEATGIGTPTQATFNYTGAEQTWMVPSGVTSVTVDAAGAEGGLTAGVGISGKGARVQTTITVTPGQTLYIYVGGAGQAGTGGVGGVGGFNGGGSGGASGGDPNGGGGGASDVRQGGNALANRVVAGGGGGGEEYNNGGDGGDPNGYSGTSGSGGGGGGATQSAGGTAGAGASCASSDGTAGALGQGGTGGPCASGRGGGGGGGGYYGGGGGGGTGTTGGAGGGGGGSSYSAGTGTTYTRAYKTGNGQVIISYNDPSGTANWTVGANQSDLGNFKIAGSSALGTNDYVIVNTSGYLQFTKTSTGAPTAADCDANAERGRLVIDTTNNRLYVCNGATRGWDYLGLTD